MARSLVRPLLRLVVFLLVPLVWLGTGSTTAQAATIYGESASATFNSGNDFTSMSCSVVGYWAVPDTGNPRIKVNGVCDQGWGSEVNGAYIGSITACGLVGGPVETPDQSWSIDLNGGVPQLLGCAQGEAHICTPSWPDGPHCDTVVFDWLIGDAPTNDTPETACPIFDPTTSPIRGTRYASQGYWKWPFTFNQTMKGQPAGEFLVYYIYRDNGTSGPARMGPFKHVTRPAIIGPHQFTEGGDFADAPDTVVGVGLVAVVAGQPGLYYSDTQFWNGSQGALGANDPASCRFYWGEKVTNVANTDTDEPTGPLDGAPITGGDPTEPTDPTPAPEPTEEGCTDFKLSDPTTWAGASICAIVQAIMSLVEKVKKLPGKMWDLISDGLTTLLVPSDGFFEGKYADMEGAWDDSSPGKYVGALDNLAPAGSAAGGCEGPAVDLDIMGTDVSGHPLAACSGATANLASLCKLLLTVGLVVFGALACVRAIGSGLGWNPQVGGSA